MYMKRINLIFLIVIAALLLPPPYLYAKDDVGLRSFANPRQITIGDRIKYTVEISASGGTELQLPDLKSNIIGDFEIKDFSSRIRERWFGKKTMYNFYYITAYSAGKKEIPGFEIKYKTKGSKDWVPKKTDVITINVLSVLPKELPPDIKDIRGPVGYFEINWPLIAILLVLFALLIIVIILIRKAAERKPVMLPHETALEELEAARAQLAGTGDIKAYFVGVSDSIRRYIERVFRLKAPEMTSEEFLNSLRDSTALTVPQKELLKGFMNACDLVKFAKYTPTGTETEDLYLTAKNFIEETRGSK